MPYAEPLTLPELFEVGMKRDLGRLEPLPPRIGDILNLGPGNNPIPGTIGLQPPEWWARDGLPFESNSIRGVHAHHFFEHLAFYEVMGTLQEINRVLVPQGVAYITVPHGQTHLSMGSLDHRTFWTERSVRDLFYGHHYDYRFGAEWDLNISFMAIMGHFHYELALQIQLIKDADYVSPWKDLR